MRQLITKDIIIYCVVILLITITGLHKFVIPQATLLAEQKKKLADNQSQIINFKSQIRQDMPTTQAKKPTPKVDLPVSIYSSPYPGLDIENSSIDLVDQFIEMIRVTQNRIFEISFTTKPADPTTPVNILSLNMALNCSYTTFQNLLQKIYTWQYLAAIKDITISPEQGDPNNLSVKLTIDLYIK